MLQSTSTASSAEAERKRALLLEPAATEAVVVRGVPTVRWLLCGRGRPCEWRRHHQGGLTGYLNREAFAVPGDETQLPSPCAVAWNPSIAGGARSEDTALVHQDHLEIVTRTPELPELALEGLA